MTNRGPEGPSYTDEKTGCSNEHAKEIADRFDWEKSEVKDKYQGKRRELAEIVTTGQLPNKDKLTWGTYTVSTDDVRNKRGILEIIKENFGSNSYLDRPNYAALAYANMFKNAQANPGDEGKILNINRLEEGDKIWLLYGIVNVKRKNAENYADFSVDLYPPSPTPVTNPEEIEQKKNLETLKGKLINERIFSKDMLRINSTSLGEYFLGVSLIIPSGRESRLSALLGIHINPDNSYKIRINENKNGEEVLHPNERYTKTNVQEANLTEEIRNSLVIYWEKQFQESFPEIPLNAVILNRTGLDRGLGLTPQIEGQTKNGKEFAIVKDYGNSPLFTIFAMPKGEQFVDNCPFDELGIQMKAFEEKYQTPQQ